MRQGLLLPRRPAGSALSRYQDGDPRAPCSVATPSKPRPRGGRPIGLDTEGHLGRNVIERGYGDVKQWRGLATRYDKLALTYRAGTVLRAIIQWLNHLL